MLCFLLFLIIYFIVIFFADTRRRSYRNWKRYLVSEIYPKWLDNILH